MKIVSMARGSGDAGRNKFSEARVRYVCAPRNRDLYLACFLSRSLCGHSGRNHQGHPRVRFTEQTMMRRGRMSYKHLILTLLAGMLALSACTASFSAGDRGYYDSRGYYHRY